MELGYARYPPAKQDLDRQIDALTVAGMASGHIYVDKKSGATTDRPGLKALLDYARPGDVIVVHTLDRLGWYRADTLNLIHQLRERGVGVRNLADPIRVDSANPTIEWRNSPWCCWRCSRRWNAPTPWNGPPTRGRWPPPKAAASAAPQWTTESQPCTPCSYAGMGAPSPRTPPPPG